MMTRFRCGNEEKENNFWMDEINKRSRICWREGETVEHMLEGCEGLRESEESREEGLNEDGRALDWMKEVQKIRELRQGVGRQKEQNNYYYYIKLEYLFYLFVCRLS
ncbi:hypothetical protein Zmor_003668 [Zophobas morio]|uniref:Uncharacterized protein n=1 Tax=Zophobas morio TaxID=2755281 RepID=A0AA38HMN3_9CUCU|nr:hypothetical protein Zmor_003668 [Zophobas morio]